MSLESAALANKAASIAQKKTVQINGASTAYWFYPSANPNPVALILIHGYRGNHRGLEAIAGSLDDFDVYIPDLPGFGASQVLPEEHSIENYAAWLQAFIAALDLRAKPVLIGHSFGTIICSKLAAQNSNAISKLVLINPVSAPALEGPKALLTKVAMGFFWFAGRLPTRLAEALLKSWPMVRGMSIVMTKSRDKTLRNWVHRQHDDNFNDFAELRVAIQGYHASISNCVGDYAQEFKTATLFIAGAKDDITSVEQQAEVFSLIKPIGSKLEIIDGVGHLTHYETPVRVAQLIRDFVGGQK